jgi:hypothetical protein
LAVNLPYVFDTIALPRNILKGFIAGSAFMLLLALAMLVKSGPLAAVPLLIASVFLGWVARKFHSGFLMTGFAGSARGTLSRDAVVVEQSALGRIPLPSPAGRHPLSRFKAVRVTYLGPRRNSGGYLFAKIYLVGRENMADVCIAYERDTAAKALAPQIAAAVELPLEQVGLAPFDH